MSNLISREDVRDFAIRVGEDFGALQEDFADLLATPRMNTASTVNSLKTIPTDFGISYLSQKDAEGVFVWDASVPVDTHQADTSQLTFVAPDPASVGAWVRQNPRFLSNPNNFGLDATGDRVFLGPLRLRHTLNRLRLEREGSDHYTDFANVEFVRNANYTSDTSDTGAVSSNVRMEHNVGANAGRSGITKSEWNLNVVTNSYSNEAHVVGSSSVIHRYGVGPVWAGHFPAFDHTTGGTTLVRSQECNIGGDGSDTNGVRLGVELLSVRADGVDMPRQNVGVNTCHAGFIVTPANADLINGFLSREQTPSRVQWGFRATSTGIGFAESADFYAQGMGNANHRGLLLRGDGIYGIDFGGSLYTHALKIGSDRTLVWSNNDAVTQAYNAATARLAVKNGANEVFGISATNGAVHIGGTKVLGAQQGALPPAATDLDSALTLLNAIRAGQIAHGLHAG